ncbi:MAG: hypothetical protein DCC75_11540, partial [Proteobacteria bacterium]
MSVAADPSQKLTAPNSVTNYSGLIGSARSWLTARLSEANPHLVLLCKNKRSAEEFAADLQLFVGDARRIILFPSWETIPFERVSPQLDVSAERLAALHYLESGEPFILILSAEAISQLVPNQESLRSRTFTLNPGVHSFEEIARKLAAGGYSKVSIVEEIGEFAQHGQVIDLYPALCPHPVRLKFEEGRLSRMDLFDAESQRSLAAIESLNVTPVREHRFTRDPRTDLQSEIERIKTRAAELDVPLRDVNEAIKAISEGHDLPGIELLHLIAKDDFQALFSHFSSDTLLVVSDPHGVEQALDDLWLNVSQREEQLSREHYLIPPKQQLYSSPEQIQALSRSFARANLNQLDLRDERGDSCTIKMRSLSNAELKTRLKTKIGSGDAYQ